ncbi:hypothetical protein ACJIZ3_022895 [Penstemon smallii]|uniref:Uncharacterized protein n=1 Tax=Penstemon smallii TaxID=265156 RepID=A0ABD3TMM0_9LAMI
MHELQGETRNVTTYQLTVNEKEIKVKNISSDQHMDMSSVVQIINPPLQPRSELSLRERLGNWTLEQKKHKTILKRRIKMNKAYHNEECYTKYKMMRSLRFSRMF